MRTCQHKVVTASHLLIALLACLLCLAACGGTGNGTTTTTATTTTGTSPTPVSTPAVDAYGTPITYPKSAPQKIVSLVPSMSEILGALNLQDRVVGVDYYTNYPAALAKKQKISDTGGKYNVEQMVALHPDLVLSAGGITKQYDSQLTQLGLHVVDLPSPDIAGTLQQIQLVGQLTFTQDAANALTKQMQQQIDTVKAKVAGTSAPKVLLEVDDSTPGKPYVFGGGSFGDELLQYANATNIFHTNTSGGGYPQVTDEAVISANPQFVILTEDPKYGGDATLVYKRSNWGSIDAVKNRKVYHINTDIMQRAGPRIVQGLQCVAQVVHPDKFSDPIPAYCQVVS
jgi:iron complex transport system substrate-binding protein